MFSRAQPHFPSAQDLQSTGLAQAELHERAFSAMVDGFGRNVFVRGVVEISNFCRQNCSYCGMRRDNKELERFRASADELAELLIEHRPPSVTDVNIQAGEDPVAVREVALPLIRALKAHTQLGISVCLGNLNPELYAELKRAGASIYILKFETADPEDYVRFSAPATMPKRLEHIRHLADTGWNVSSGFIAGLPGQSMEAHLKNFALAAELPLAGCSVSPFVPGEQTPLQEGRGASIDLTLNSMAALRLMRPNWVIPAVSALNLAEPGAGYRRGLRTGANLVTINMTPPQLREEYLLYKRERFIMTEERILKAIEEAGLNPSKQGLAAHYDEQRQAATRSNAA
ncbi:MAG TPA: radical SAM protein [Methylomirabilota bacterium]|nr:radical SAM protein [Methylomirabilota bacterium]